GKENSILLSANCQNEKVNMETGFFIEASKPWATDGITFQEIIPRLPVYQLLNLLSKDVEIEQGHRSEFYENYLKPLTEVKDIKIEEGLQIKPEDNVPAQPVLIIVERKRVLYIHLSFQYGNCKDLVTLGDRRSILELPLENENETLWFERNRRKEERNLRRILKFNLIKSGEFTYTLEGDPAFDFLFDAIPILKKEGWDIKGLENLKEYSLTAGYPEFHVIVKSNLGFIDLSWKMLYEGKELPLVEYWRAFELGQYSYEAGDGVSVRVNEHWFKRMRDTLHDLFAICKDTASKGYARLNHYQASIIEDFVNAATHYDIDDDWRNFSERFNKFEGISHVPVPKSLQGELREYQQEGFDWLCFLKEFGFSGVLADDMGLGKTIQALTLIENFRLKGEEGPSLVIAPTSVAFNWVKEANKFFPDIKVLLLSGKERKAKFKDIKNYDLVITNYALARIDHKTLDKIGFFYLILDEAHYIKNPQSQTAIAVRTIKAQFRLALTGTPLENHLGELWSQFNFLMPGFLGDGDWFDIRYRKPIENHNNQNLLRKLNKRISPFIMRRLKSEVALDLPEKTVTTLFCEMESQQRDFYLELQELFKKKVIKEADHDSSGKSHLLILDALLKLRQTAIHPELLNLEKLKEFELEKPEQSAKMDLLKDMIHEMVSGGNHRALIFSQFTTMLGIIRTYLDEENISYCYLDGSSRNREEAVEAFQQDETIPIFLISLKAGGVGLNLTGADYVIHMDPWWNPAVEEQANDRAYRIGQSKQVFVYRLVTSDTIEERILKLQESKKALFDGVVTGGRFEKSLSKQDLIDLFS
ncbi:DEAD/DEAH box helicase, partial [Candidatus Riflebacteria bacterium]